MTFPSNDVLKIYFVVTVSDLKAELKRRNLPTSGSKYVLTERLIKSNSNSTKTKLRPVAPAMSKESSPDIAGDFSAIIHQFSFRLL